MQKLNFRFNNNRKTAEGLFDIREENRVNPNVNFNPICDASKITFIYLILGCLWILLSDRIASNWLNDREMLTLVSIIKGLVYVTVSAYLIFALIFNSLKRIKKAEQKLLANYQELTSAHKELERVYKEVAASQEKLHYLAYHDLLTELPNKLLIQENSKGIFASEGNKVALLLIDIDNFKYINDTMGHAFGDQLIKKAGKRLAALLKDDCSLYSLGADDFIIIVRDIGGHEDAKAFASYILAGFNEGFEVMDSVLHITVSIGIVIYPDHGSDIDELFKYADNAMYKAKEAGKNRYAVYDKLMNEAFAERMSIEKHLHTALKNNEFSIYYQPQLDTKTKKIAGFEALLRWNSPELGFVPPSKFISVAEDTHLIIPIGAWVLRSACSFAKELYEMGYRDLTVSINISILQLLQSDFIDLVMNTLEFFGLEPKYLEIEITESILMNSFDAIKTKLEKLREYGIGIALDDFGKGYSSLSYLRQLPISVLKIDKSFIDSITDENDIVIKHICSLGISLGMCVVAEGVEKQEQMDVLARHGCHKIQGYFFSKPVPEDQAAALLEKCVY